MKFIPPPPNCKSIYQQLDLGNIACLNRKCKRWLLDLVLRALDARFVIRMASGFARGGGGGAPAEGSESAASGWGAHADAWVTAAGGGGARIHASVGTPAQPFTACSRAGEEFAADGAASAAGTGAERIDVLPAGTVSEDES